MIRSRCEKGGSLSRLCWAKSTSLPQLAPDAVAVRLLREEAAQALGRHVGRVVERCRSRRARGDGLLVDVRGEDLHGGADRKLRGVLQQQHRHRVRLLARGAARHPDAHVVARAFALEEFGDDLLLDALEGLRSRKKFVTLMSRSLRSALRLLRVLAHEARVVGQVREFVTLMRRSMRRSTVARL